MTTLIVSESDLRAILSADAGSLAAVEDAFTMIQAGRVSMPPVMHIDIDPQSAVDTKGAHIDGFAHLAVKIATGFFKNPDIGLPSCSSVVALINAGTGLFDCIFLDNGYLMDLRTGLAGAVAARHLAPAEVETVGVVGTGAQARHQIACLALVRDFDRLLVHGRRRDRVDAYCADMAARLGIEVAPAEDLETLVRSAQIVVTTTSATRPLIRADWLHPGLHITAMGSDLPGKQELDPEILRRADLVVCDSRAQCRIGGELQAMAAAGITREVVELGALTAGTLQPGPGGQRVSICDLTGTGAQDTAIACEAFRRIGAAGSGSGPA